ncbi:MAG TPA: hypothetical protein VGQ62_10420 [Chloroflexota bacterium]|jgi:hypothetical protein|nr:hypothetical protein [Chloroflexota bacterium]
MRSAEKLVLVVAVMVPLFLVLVGWRMFSGWLGGPPRSASTLEAPGATATSVAVVQPRGNATVVPTSAANSVAVAGVLATAAPEVASRAQQISPQNPIDPGEAVSSFYALIESHQFETAAQLWSPRMVASFPPQQNIDQRFNQTQSIRLQRVDVISQDQSRATVAVDLVEATAQGPRHYAGTWQLVRGAAGWLLDQPNLQTAP